MNTVRLSNIPLKTLREFLFDSGCSRIDIGTKGRGRHEKWGKEGMGRPITLQTHIDPVPEHIVKNCLRDLGLQRKHLENWLLSRYK